MDAVDERSGAWQVVATRRALQRGWCLPALIRNQQYHYTQLNVFEDGVVDCWQGLDLPLFRAKLATGWIATSAPVGSRFSVFNLGSATVERFEPRYSLADVAARVEAAVRAWNPACSDLVDLGGDASELRGRVRHAKLPSLDGAPFRQDGAGERWMAREVPVVLMDRATPRLTRWFVYADGRSRLGPEGELLAWDVAEEAVASGRVATQLPDHTWVAIDGVGRAQFSDGRWGVDPLERITEQRDHLDVLRGGEGTRAVCMQRWAEFQADPTEPNRERLRAAYRAVPEHLRMYCGDMDTRDRAIRDALAHTSARRRV